MTMSLRTFFSVFSFASRIHPAIAIPNGEFRSRSLLDRFLSTFKRSLSPILLTQERLGGIHLNSALKTPSFRAGKTL
ncbi:hypothetical protein, partial [Roseibium sp. RKSG952]|uniref:hypothetical protein n=1 Tax=Roseibium sp. RKSG952 TaxID=2529384 RepID=UPI001AD8B873